MMDISQVLWSLSSITSPVADDRKNAEKYLKWAEDVPGFSIVLFQVLTKPDQEVPIHTKQAASIIFKQIIIREWDGRGGDDHLIRITDQERKYIKDNVVELTIQSPPRLREQLGVVIHKIADRDYPNEWPEILPKIVSFFTSEQRDVLIPGTLFVLSNLCKIYHYRTPESGMRDSLYKIINSTFQYLFIIFTNLVNMNTIDAADIIVNILKIFSAVIQFTLPPMLMDNNAIQPWLNAFFSLLTKEVPLHLQPEDIELRPKWGWWKAKKVAGNILTNLFTRYSGKTDLDDEKTAKFAPQFFAAFSGQIIQTFLNVLVRDYKIMPDRNNHVFVNLLNAGIRISSTYKMLRPHIHALLTDIIFPQLCFSADDDRCWREDPQEFIRKEYDVIEEYYSAKRTAVNFIVDLMNLRSRANLNHFMAFLVGVLNKYHTAPADQKKPEEKDGALLAIGSIANKLLKLAEYNNSLDDMLAVHVFPDFQSPFGFLRQRANWVFGQFCEAEFKNAQLFLSGLEMVLRSMRDPELPVRVQAALTIRNLILVDAASEQIEKILPQILEEFFNIMNEIDNDDLVSSLETIVDKYQEQIPPFAISLCDRLAKAFLRVASDEEEDSAALAALEYIRTIHTVLISIAKLPHLYAQIEVVLYPLLTQSLKPECVDYIEEILRTMTFITYYSPTISPNMWSLFPLIYQAFNDFATDFISNILIVMDNFISRGTEQFLAPGTNYLEMVFNMYKKLLEDDQWSTTDSGEACKLIEVVLHHCRNNARVDGFIQPIIELAVRRIPTSPMKSFTVLLIEVVANSLHYNPQLALSALEQTGSTQLVFTSWFTHVFTDFKRCHDMKVSILGLSSIYLVPFESLPPTIKGGFSQIFTGILKLIVKLRLQREEEEKKAAEEEEEEEEEEVEEVDDDEDVQEDIDDIETTMDKVRQFTSASDLDELHDDENEEYSTAIDLIHEHLYFVEVFQGAANREPAVYQQLVASASAEDQALLQQLIEQVPQVSAKHQEDLANMKHNPSD